MRYLLTLTLLLSSTTVLHAQAPVPPAAPSQDAKVDLTEGLLDLLKEPTPSKQPQPGTPDPLPKSAMPPKSEHSGEDIGQGPANPLADVELGMNTLAQWLRVGPEVKRTQTLQRDIVLRLDDLILQLEKQSAGSSSSQSSSSTNTSQQSSTSNSAGANSTPMPAPPSNNAQKTQASEQNKAGQNRSDNGESLDEQGRPSQGDSSRNAQGPSNKPDNNAPGNEASDGNQPGLGPLKPRNVAVELNDPTALQRSAWGKLPERMREQMQSRMVERFLPGYREEIEAYYRALVQ